MTGFGAPGREESTGTVSTPTTKAIKPPHPVVAGAVLDDLDENDGYSDYPLRDSLGTPVGELPEDLQDQLPDSFEAVSFESVFNVEYDGNDGYPDDVVYIEHPDKENGDTSEDLDDDQVVYPHRAGHTYHAWQLMTAWYFDELVDKFGTDDGIPRLRVGQAKGDSKRGFEDDEERLQYVGVETVATENTYKQVFFDPDSDGAGMGAIMKHVDEGIVEKYLDDDNEEYGLSELTEDIAEKRQEEEPWAR